MEKDREIKNLILCQLGEMFGCGATFIAKLIKNKDDLLENKDDFLETIFQSKENETCKYGITFKKVCEYSLCMVFWKERVYSEDEEDEEDEENEKKEKTRFDYDCGVVIWNEIVYSDEENEKEKNRFDYDCNVVIVYDDKFEMDYDKLLSKNDKTEIKFDSREKLIEYIKNEIPEFNCEIKGNQTIGGIAFKNGKCMKGF